MIKVEFTKTTFDIISKQRYRIGQVVEIDEEFYKRCKELNAVKNIVTNVPEVQAKELEEKIKATKEEEQKERDSTEKVIEEALIKQEEEFNLAEYVKGLKLAELKEFAKTNNVNLKGKTKKADILEVILEEIRKG